MSIDAIVVSHVSIENDIMTVNSTKVLCLLGMINSILVKNRPILMKVSVLQQILNPMTVTHSLTHCCA